MLDNNDLFVRLERESKGKKKIVYEFLRVGVNTYFNHNKGHFLDEKENKYYLESLCLPHHYNKVYYTPLNIVLPRDEHDKHYNAFYHLTKKTIYLIEKYHKGRKCRDFKSLFELSIPELNKYNNVVEVKSNELYKYTSIEFTITSTIAFSRLLMIGEKENILTYFAEYSFNPLDHV